MASFDIYIRYMIELLENCCAICHIEADKKKTVVTNDSVLLLYLTNAHIDTNPVLDFNDPHKKVTRYGCSTVVFDGYGNVCQSRIMNILGEKQFFWLKLM